MIWGLMPSPPIFKKSNNVAVLAKDVDSARRFYSDVLQMTITSDSSTGIELRNDDSHFYVMQNEKRATVLEFFVNDLEAARDHLVQNGCKVIRWEGKGKDCYIQDPFGTVFNLWETDDL